jgi:threonine synthase
MSSKTWQSVLERYSEFFPFLSLADDPRLGEGQTPLIRDEALAAETGLAGLFFKNETVNPTWSFKDRGIFEGFLDFYQCGRIDRLPLMIASRRKRQAAPP